MVERFPEHNIQKIGGKIEVGYDKENEMISRTWHGIVPIEMKDAFEKYEYETGVKETLAISGNRGAFLKIVEQGDYAHFFLCTKWDAIECVIAYAGDNPTIAVTYPEDGKYGLISDPIFIIQEVPDDRNPFGQTF